MKQSKSLKTQENGLCEHFGFWAVSEIQDPKTPETVATPIIGKKIK